MNNPPPPPLTGSALIAATVKTLPGKPGVYRMLDASGETLYVGKARHLRKRVASYAQPGRHGNRIERMIARTAEMAFTTTRTETDALLLEANLIKRLKPRFNILLRDDKSFPGIILTQGHEAPRVMKHRGARRKTDYYGPFASVGALNHTLDTLQRGFLLRSCTDSVYESRTRPCLLHQIKRCSAPCTGEISLTDYAALVEEARAFLSGRSRSLQESLSRQMAAAGAVQDYELAARCRDRIRALTRIQGYQGINPRSVSDADVIAGVRQGGQTCFEVFFIRGGQNRGNRAYFPRHGGEVEITAVLESFLGQFYENRTPPQLILIDREIPSRALLSDALSQRAEWRVSVHVPRRGEKLRLVDYAQENARDSLARHLSESVNQKHLLEGVGRVFGLPDAPERIEVYDNSHLQGSLPVGAMIVAGPEGFAKGLYRRFHLRESGAAEGDDYAMMREVLTRRFTRLLKEHPEGGADWPDLVLLDGGAGQLSCATSVLAELNIERTGRRVVLAAMAKGEDRNAGRERFFMPDRTPFMLESGDPVLYYLQRARDEAHRFAVGAHRDRRRRGVRRNPLDEIPGIGAKRKHALLHHFGSARAVAQAAPEDLAAVAGISAGLARTIHAHFLEDGA